MLDMEKCKWKNRILLILLCLLTVCAGCVVASDRQEEMIVSRFGEVAVFDPYVVLNEASIDMCSWIGTECFIDGKVLALHKNDLCLKIPPPVIENLCSDFFFTGNEIELQHDRKNDVNGMIRRLLDTKPKSPNPKSLPETGSTLNPKSSKKTTARKTNASKHKTSRVYILIGVAIGVVIAAVTSILFFICTKCRNMDTINPQSPGLSGHLQNAFVTGVPSLKRAEIEAASENFSNIIITLPDMVLYKGILSSGSEITIISTLVTSSSNWSEQCQTHFRNKVSSLSTVNHKNFMNLVGYCEEEEPFTRMMVFEYAPNGTLFDILHSKEAEELDWKARMRIMMGVIYCLEHMHSLNPKVTLKSLNSSSIFLTEDYAAKLTDPRIFLVEKDSDCDSSSSSSSDSDSDSDEDKTVYKFGTLLLETISGRRQFSNDYGLLVLWASSYLNGQRPVSSMMDSTLREVPPEGQIGNLTEVVKACINVNANERPSVADLASRMRGILGISPVAAARRTSPLWWAELEIMGEGEEEQN